MGRPYPNDTTTHKTCRKCTTLKPREDFYKHNSTLDKLMSWCKKCCFENKKRNYSPEE